MQTVSALQIKTTINCGSKESLMKNGVGILTASNIALLFFQIVSRGVIE